MQSPVKKEYITQTFGANPASYSRFGLKGHNGIDYRAFLPNGERCSEGGKSEVFAPHDGKVIECAFDAGGYGNYVKIESVTQGSVLAHFSSLPNLKVGQTVKQGDFIGYQGTTGNSTGIHLHWGWYPIPRSRNNGYNGYENQAGAYQPYKESGGSMANMYKGYDLANPESMKVAVDVLVRLQASELIEKTKHEQLMKAQLDTLIKEKDVAVGEAYARGLKECESKPTQPAQFTKTITIAGQELVMSGGANVTIGNTSVNYKTKV